MGEGLRKSKTIARGYTIFRGGTVKRSGNALTDREEISSSPE
jgi:hypothetical protein